METAKLKKFAQAARTELRRQVETKLIQALHASSAARRENPQAVAQLERQIQESSKEQVIERVAYTWFNRFCALRFLDVNGFTNPRVLTPMEGQITPEILAEAKMALLDEELVTGKTREKVLDLLAGKAPSSDPQGEAYRLLLVSVCNQWYGRMPFLFEQIADYTELLMPEDLLSQGSIVTSLREVMSEEVCQDVEVIGWLYQFYIAEKKDEVFAGLKKNIKITAENIPAATQLFTPHWIVRYLVENSLGRLWLLNRPQSKLAEKMEYYIAPEKPETDFLRVSSPEDIRICDPACGSGHMLTYAFDLLYAIYEEEGYDSTEIPALILTNNLYGVEIDERAGALAAFALVMKAAARLGRRRFLRMEAQPNICVLENVSFTPNELHDVVAIMGRDLFTDELRETLVQFEYAKNFGSLIVPKLCDPAETLRAVEARDFRGDLLLKEVQERVVTALRMAEVLSPKYHVVIANPPYMGDDGMNAELVRFAKSYYPKGKSNVFAMFIERSMSLSVERGMASMVTLQNWMFLPSFSELRAQIVGAAHISNLLQIGYNSFPEMNSKVVQAAAFVLERGGASKRGNFINVNDAAQSADKDAEFLKRVFDQAIYRVSTREFAEIPGSPIAYWISSSVRNLFHGTDNFDDHFHVKAGISTGENATFILGWHEVGFRGIALNDSSDFTYAPHNKGGDFRRWSGNRESVLKYSGRHLSDMEKRAGFRHDGKEFYFHKHVGWSKITSGKPSFRVFSDGFTFDSAGLALFPKGSRTLEGCLAFLNSAPALYLTKIISSSLNITPQVIKKLPASEVYSKAEENAATLIQLAASDWDAYETSWDFTKPPLLVDDHRAETLGATYARLRTHWQRMTSEMQRLEEENNRIFIEAYGLLGELKPQVPLEEITLTCNPAYRYGVKSSEADRETSLCTDTMAELLSYAVGCMFGRYSLDSPGLILANQGERLEDYLDRVPQPTFMPDEDNVIPVLDGDWFPDDITERFRQFLRLTFGDELYEDNLAFIEKALGKDLRKYFLKDFYGDHLKRCKKRPIYWLFSSPKGTFNALIYLHRYRPDTVSVVLQYLRDFRKKLAARLDYLQQVAISTSASQGEKTKANKEAESIKKQLLELDDYERETLYPLATEQVHLDLDDGVKVNYLKLGAALKKIPGLEAKED
jgi:Eco57I restriction-modification methylase